MNIKKISTFLITFLLVAVICVPTILAQEEELVDPKIPDSWYKAPVLSSEAGIEEFKQSPMLDQKVKDGKIPAIEERLPLDPPVQEPYAGTGKYGGTAQLWSLGTLIGPEIAYYWNNSSGGRATPEGEVVPYFLKGWEYSNDYKKLTINLREGIKWSDGELLTADDYMYWWDHVAHNEDLTPVPPEKWSPALVEMTKEDDYTVTFTYNRTVPNQYLELFRSSFGANDALAPAHYMKQFHPDFVEEEKVKEMAEEADLDHWSEYYLRIQDDSPNHPDYEHVRPVLTPYIVVERSETQAVLERNPYFPIVDSEGNQLPYIDKIEDNLANNEEMKTMKASTGEATFLSRGTSATDIPLFKNNEEAENYRTLIYYSGYGGICIMPNLTTEDSNLREVFQDERFRKALSLSLDRENINKKVFYGAAVPRQATVPPVNEAFEDSFAEAYADYSPEEAEKFLEEMGMVDVNNDGYRETPSGEKFNPELIFVDLWEVPKMLELAKTNWEDIGLNIDIKMVSRELYNERWPANQGDMTVWVMDGVIGNMANSLSGMRDFAPVTSPGYTQWPGWVHWYQSDGEEGEEPPEEMKELIEYAETVAFTTDKDKRISAQKELLEAQAENIWLIGVVGFPPHPVVAANELKNVPEKSFWDYSVGDTYHVRPEQFYLDE